MEYLIYEENFERAMKKLNKIANKCEKYGIKFTLEIKGYEYKDNKRYYKIEADGVAKLNDWRFIARVEQEENGNIFYGVDNSVSIPERYRTSEIVCEHCGNTRTKKGYLVYKETTQEMKMVGRNCLCDYIAGLDLNAIATYYSYFDELIKGEEPYTGVAIVNYYPIKDALLYVLGLVNTFGYVKKDEYTDPCKTTGFLSLQYYLYGEDKDRTALSKKEIDHFNMCQFKTESNRQMVEDMLAWIKEQTAKNDYMHNLITICTGEYVNAKNWGIMASLVPVYKREMERLNKIKNCSGEYVGNIGDKVSLDNISVSCITGYETMYGYTYIYKIIDNNTQNVFCWKTSKYLETDKVKSIKGTIKAHTDKYGKQTELTRCKIA